MRQSNRLFVSMLAVAMIATALPASAGRPKGVCQSGGVASRVLGEAQRQYFEWYLGASDQQEVGRLFFVPMPVGESNGGAPEIFVGKESFAVRTGKTLVLPMSVYIGESYLDSLDPPVPDDPVDYPEREFFTGSSVLLTVDGRAIVDSARTKLDCVYFDAAFFTAPIEYSVPTDYGADAALWVKGLGILLPPMPPGVHVIRLKVLTPWNFGYDNTWRVTVAPPRKGG